MQEKESIFLPTWFLFIGSLLHSIPFKILHLTYKGLNNQARLIVPYHHDTTIHSEAAGYLWFLWYSKVEWEAEPSDASSVEPPSSFGLGILIR